jgi:hypothetical protein
MILKISTDTQSWLYLKHALHEAGLRFIVQEDLFDPYKTLFIDKRAEDPEGGRLSHGLIVYDGGAIINSQVQEVYDQEVTTPVLLLDKPAAKSSTNVASASTVCSSCGCRIGPGQTNIRKCSCRCHGTDTGEKEAS